MAKKSMNWTVGNGILACEHLDIEQTQEFDLSELFDNVEDFNEVQINTVAYGIKQKLADSCARPKELTLTGEERVAQLDAVWARLLEGDWNQKGVTRGVGIKKSDLELAYEKADDADKATMRKLFGDQLKNAGII